MKHNFNPGFTLLEVLITVIIFSVGLLGLAGLQVKGLTLSQDSLLRTTATLMANDMADRMRANINASKLGLKSPYNNASNLNTGNPNCLSKNTLGQSINTQCTPTEMALHDFYEWNAILKGQASTGWHPSISAQLPSGAGIVCIDSTPNDGTPNNPQCDNIPSNNNINIFTIKIWWQERKIDPKNNQYTTHSYITSVAI